MVCSSLPLGFLLNLKNKTSIWFVVVVVVCVFVLELFYRLITFRPRKKAKVCAKDDKKQTVLILLVYLTPVWYVCGKKEGLFFSSCDSSSMRRTYAARTHTHTHTHLPTRGYLLYFMFLLFATPDYCCSQSFRKGHFSVAFILSFLTLYFVSVVCFKC